MNKLKVWHISDSHSYHYLLKTPENIDLVIFSGDESNYYEVSKNEAEAWNFINWFKKLPIPNKIFIAGNHSAAIAKGRITKKDFDEANIIYIENDYITIEGIKIFGSPLTPTFNNWYFMKNRSKLDDVWKIVHEDVDIMVTHGPPKGVLDLSYNINNKLEFCGDKALLRHVTERIKPKLHLFGHVHNSEDIINNSILMRDDITFSNASLVKDNHFGTLVSNGNIFALNKKT